MGCRLVGLGVVGCSGFHCFPVVCRCVVGRMRNMSEADGARRVRHRCKESVHGVRAGLSVQKPKRLREKQNLKTDENKNFSPVWCRAAFKYGSGPAPGKRRETKPPKIQFREPYLKAAWHQYPYLRALRLRGVDHTHGALRLRGST
jgi:hypothetical protein